MPVAAILLACGVQMVLNSIYFGTFTGFETVISIATEGFCTSAPFSLFSFFFLSSVLAWPGLA